MLLAFFQSIISAVCCALSTSIPSKSGDPANIDPTTGAARLQPYVCSLVRNALSFFEIGGMNIVDMLLVPHARDSHQGLGSVMLDEIDRRISEGIGAVKDERKRLLWDNLPIWYRLRYIAEYFGRHGIAIVASTYTNAWGELAQLIDPVKGLESIARSYIHAILNRGTGYKLRTTKRMIVEFRLDGAILHSDRSCKPYSLGQMDQRDKLVQELNTPALLLEADHNDARAYSEAQVANRLDAFVEVLGG